MNNLVGTTLENGAFVIAQKDDVVLAHWARGAKGIEFITWQVDTEGNAYWGHYKDDLSEALNDFKKRIGLPIVGYL